eukprot:TRINITY_DN5867_c0_g1_i1.p1 TRINITY_DN5867_c0_g1~~TRINITY_DN5867_c0_g1_i1.p1  ORF type:complete len:340 (-),score=34.45 TRINITY_DN5867_c0_g1_i1:44-1003(-)
MDAHKEDFPPASNPFVPEQTHTSSTPSINVETNDYLKNQLETVKKIDLLMKIHLLAALIISSICFFVWHWTSTHNNIHREFWWWIYPVLSCLMTLSLHYFMSQKQPFRAVAAIVILINVLVILTWALTDPKAFPWFMYVNFGTAMILISVYYFLYKREHMWPLTIHLYWLLNAMLFFTWVFTNRGFPWFFYPLLALAFPIVIRRLKTKHNESRRWVLSGVFFLWLGCIVFVTWGFSNSNFPWFLFAWMGFIIAVVVIYMRTKNDPPPTTFEPIAVTPSPDVKVDLSHLSSQTEDHPPVSGTTSLYPPIYPGTRNESHFS